MLKICSCERPHSGELPGMWTLTGRTSPECARIRVRQVELADKPPWLFVGATAPLSAALRNAVASAGAQQRSLLYPRRPPPQFGAKGGAPLRASPHGCPVTGRTSTRCRRPAGGRKGFFRRHQEPWSSSGSEELRNLVSVTTGRNRRSTLRRRWLRVEAFPARPASPTGEPQERLRRGAWGPAFPQHLYTWGGDHRLMTGVPRILEEEGKGGGDQRRRCLEGLGRTDGGEAGRTRPSWAGGHHCCLSHHRDVEGCLLKVLWGVTPTSSVAPMSYTATVVPPGVSNLDRVQALTHIRSVPPTTGTAASSSFLFCL